MGPALAVHTQAAQEGAKAAPAPKSPATLPTPQKQPRAEPEPELTRYFVGSDCAAAFWSKRWLDAARACAQWPQSNPNSKIGDKARLLGGVAQLYSGNSKGAAVALDSLVGRMGQLNDYVLLLATEAHARQHDHKQVLQHLDALSKQPFAQQQRAGQLRARALMGMGELNEAANAFESHLKRYASETPSFRLAAAATLQSANRRNKAAEQLRIVLARHPRSRSARAAKKRLSKYPRSYRSLSVDDELLQQKSLFARQRHKESLLAGARVQRRARTGNSQWCKAGYLNARTLEKQKKKRQSLPVFEQLVARCKRSDSYVDILYFGGKRQMRSGDSKRALYWFAQMRTLAPKHSYVDDAMRWEARILRDLGRHREADSRLEDVLSGNGDMREDAAWDLIWHHFNKGDLVRADALAAKAVNAISRESKSYTNGRLRYWRGRIAQLLGQRVRAALAYDRCIREYPLSYYGLLASRRLESLDSKAAEEALSAARKAPDIRSILASNKARLAAPAMARAVELLRLGLVSYARAELKLLKLGGPDRPHEDWLKALLYDRVGDHTEAYKIARWRRGEYAQHYPVGHHRERWEISYPRPVQYRSTVEQAARTHGIDDALVWAVMRHESAFRPGVVSFANAVGLMQLILPTGRAMAKREGITGRVDRRTLQQPLLNIKLGTRYLGRLARRFESHPALMAAGYNAGPGAPTKWMRLRPGEEVDVFVERIPYRETRRYTKSVVTSYLRYRYLYGGAETPRVALQLPPLK